MKKLIYGLVSALILLVGYISYNQFNSYIGLKQNNAYLKGVQDAEIFITNGIVENYKKGYLSLQLSPTTTIKLFSDFMVSSTH